MKETLKIFYDGQCPLCVNEMRELMRFNRQQRVTFIDIHQDTFPEKWPQISKQEAMRKIHGELNGEIISGLDVTYHAWRLVGKSCRVAWLKWPLVSPVADRAYLVFAKHRHRISRFLSPWLPAVDKECDVCQTKVK